jgi:hypothetical protein
MRIVDRSSFDEWFIVRHPLCAAAHVTSCDTVSGATV